MRAALEQFVVFVGYGRSGHTLVGALLDGHPRALVANEADAVALLDRGLSGDAILREAAEKTKGVRG